MSPTIDDVKSLAKTNHDEIIDLSWKISGAAGERGDVASLIATQDVLIEKYVQLRLNMALSYGEVTLD